MSVGETRNFRNGGSNDNERGYYKDGIKDDLLGENGIGWTRN